LDIVAIIVVIVGIFLAIKVVGFLFKFAVIALVIGALYWLVASNTGMPLPF
jgi:hypothetical protein